MTRINAKTLFTAVKEIKKSGVVPENDRQAIIQLRFMPDELSCIYQAKDERIASSISCKNDFQINVNISISDFLDALKAFPETEELLLSHEEKVITISDHSGYMCKKIALCNDLSPSSAVLMPDKFIKAEGIIERISSAAYAASKHGIRQSLRGILLEHDAIVASDGKILIYQAFTTGTEAPCIIPAQKIFKRTSLVRNTEIAFSSSGESRFCHFRSGNICYSVQCINGIYPRYRDVIPNENPSHIKFILPSNDICDISGELQRKFSQSLKEEITIAIYNQKAILSSSETSTPLEIKMEMLEPSDISGCFSINGMHLLYALNHGCRKFSWSGNKYGPAIFSDGEKKKFVFIPALIEEFKKEKSDMNSEKVSEVVPQIDKMTEPQEKGEFKILEGDMKNQDIFEDIAESLDELRHIIKSAFDNLNLLSRKLKEAKASNKQREREFKDTRDLISKLKKASGF